MGGTFFSFLITVVATMSQVPDCLNPTQEDIARLIACDSHTGSTNCDQEMVRYIFKRRGDGVHVFNLLKTWEKLVLAARAIAAVENPSCLRNFRRYIWSTCCIKIRKVHWSNCHCWKIYPWYLYQSNPKEIRRTKNLNCY